MKNVDKNNLMMGEVSVGVSFTSFLTAVSTFFTGFLLANYKDYDSSVNVPILFLIISTMSFMYATTVLANASGDLVRNSGKKFEKFMFIGNVVAEYSGIYLLISAIPLAVGAITGDIFFQVATFVSAMLGLLLYSASDLSIIHRHFRGRPKLLLTFSFIFISSALFAIQAFSLPFYLETAIFYITLIVIISFIILKKPEIHD